MAQKPHSVDKFVLVLAFLALIVVAITTWAARYKSASAVPIPTDAIYRTQYLNLF